MFWKKARARYAHVTADDPDVRRFHEVVSESQREGYSGVVGWIQDLGHRWVASRRPRGRVLEIGFGQGRHARFFSGDRSEYFVSEMSATHMSSPDWAEVRARAIVCDARRLPYKSASFNAVISIYNLEHIGGLQEVLSEVHRVLRLHGRFLIALPCEGGLAWNLGRELTTMRYFRDRYGINYDKIIAYEHVWDLGGVIEQIERSGLFSVQVRRYYPFLLPSVHVNLVACLECRQR